MYDRPEEPSWPVISRVPPCSHCGHDEHILRCLVDIDHSDVPCPCRGVPIPGDTRPPIPHHPPSTGV